MFKQAHDFLYCDDIFRYDFKLLEKSGSTRKCACAWQSTLITNSELSIFELKQPANKEQFQIL